jgi:hypothetical protein
MTGSASGLTLFTGIYGWKDRSYNLVVLFLLFASFGN